MMQQLPIEKQSPRQIYNERVVDIYFSNSYKNALDSSFCTMLFLIVRPLLLGLLLVINSCFLTVVSTLFLSFSLSFITYNMILIVQSIVLYFKLKQTQRCKSLALQLNHAAESHLGQQSYCQVTRLSVSKTIYDFTTLQQGVQISEEERKIRESRGANIITGATYALLPCSRFQSILLGITSVLLFIYGMVVLNAFAISQYERTVLIILILTEVLTQLTVYVFAFILAISPVVCLLVLVVACCCTTRKKVVLPPKEKATIEHVSKTNECPICFQNIVVGDQIMILPCSNMHLFHELCITAWCKVKPICPMCRHQLTQ